MTYKFDVKTKYIAKNLILFVLYGILYVLIEILYRNYSHWSMFLLGGLCGILIGIINEYYSWEMPFWKQVLIGEFMVLNLEFLTGCLVNVLFDWNIWDYSSIPFNLFGQICLPFAILWIPLIAITIILDDYLRYWFFKEEKPHYKFF